MASRTATTPRVTGGRPATMTRSAVQQARTQGRPTTPTPSLDLPEPTFDGWVNVDHHKRKHKPGSSSTTTGATGLVPSTGRVRNPVAVEGNGRDLRRTQSAVDATAVGDEPPIARPNARADALSAAVTMDKKARERSYYANATASGSATSPSNGLSLMPPSTAAWGSPPPPPGLESQRGLHKSTSLVSPDALQLDRGSSLEKLMSSWQLADDAKDSPGRAARQNPPAKASTNSDLTATLGGIFDFSFTEFPAEPPSVTLRRTQSDVVPSTMAMPHNGNRQRSPTGRLPAEAKTNGNTNGNGNANANGNTASRKCGDKRDFFFRNLDFETRSLLQIDEVASFSVTDFEMARKISSAIVDLFPEMKAYVEQQAAAASGFYDSFGGGNGYYYDPSSVPQPPRKYPLIITDATACVGGNVLSFCDFFHFVYAIENDATRVAMLENNLRVLQKTNVACRCASYLDVMYEYHQDVIFFDPPWGGPEYKDQDKVDLYLDEQPLYEICEQLHGYAKVIVLKVPTNFDDEKFAYCVSGRVTVRKDFKKMHLVVLDFR